LNRPGTVPEMKLWTPSKIALAGVGRVEKALLRVAYGSLTLLYGRGSDQDRALASGFSWSFAGGKPIPTDTN
jgi:hypothetical protein